MPEAPVRPHGSAPSKVGVEPSDAVVVRGGRQHNLKDITVRIPRGRITVVTGISGSGKSSLAFDTIYAEGQRRYVESLSAYARQFLGLMEKPDVDSVEGLSPAVAIEQKTVTRNPRSTVGTVTELYDHLRLLWARIGSPHCVECGRQVLRQTPSQIVDQVLRLEEDRRIEILAPMVRGRKGEFRELFERAHRDGFVRVRVDGETHDLADPPKLKRSKDHDISIVVDRVKVRERDRDRIADSVETALRTAEGVVEVLEHVDGDLRSHLFSEHYACPHCGTSLPELEPRQFSFNSPYGACPSCGGLGTRKEVDPELLVGDRDASILDGAILPWGAASGDVRDSVIPGLARAYEFDPATPWRDLPRKVQKGVLHGSGRMSIAFPAAQDGDAGGRSERWEGVAPMVERRYRETGSERVRERLEAYMTDRPCEECGGTRLRAESLAVTVGERSLGDVVGMSVAEAARFFQGLAEALGLGEDGDTEAVTGASARMTEVARPVLREVNDRLRFLLDVGLGYLTLNRSAATLSGGEGQRIRLATQIGSRLVGVLYVLDEPSIGLHPRDNRQLLETLEALRDLGNTVLVVEHDEDTMRSADHIVDLGPGAGRNGGEVVAEGPVGTVEATEGSLTGAYLRRERAVPVPETRRPEPKRALRVRGARGHNLQGVDVSIPLGLFTVVTGVSGSGKSSLVNETLNRALARRFHGAKAAPLPHDGLEGLDDLDKVVEVDQSPIGRTPRSNPATYTGLFTPIREMFAQLPEARMRGYGPGRFSFNVKGGRCEACQGEGLVKIEMHFLPDVYVACDRCRGRRYNRETLEVHYRGLTIADVLDLTVDEALEFFDAVPRVRDRLEILAGVGLGYLRLGQPATTLSGGEAQRVKLATELGKRSTGRTLYILDEPTTGLHFDDVRVLLEVLHRLVERGNSVVVIEHNLEVVKTADWIVDLGPEGGAEGGRVVATGSPEEVAATAGSHTGRFLAGMLHEGAAVPSGAISSRSGASDHSDGPEAVEDL